MADQTKKELNRKVLVVDDDPQSLRLLGKALAYEGYKVETASSGEEAVSKLSGFAPHLILLDINMPGIGGMETLQFLRRKREYVAVIFISGNTDTDHVVQGLDAGADDYIRKPFEIQEVLARVRAKLRIKDLHDELREANVKLKDLIDIDDLTGLFNMRSLYQKLEYEIMRARRSEKSVSVVMMDLDNFKNANDQHDHLFGSFVLSEVGQIIHDNIRVIDFAARYGGDEFLVVLPDCDTEGCRNFAERLRRVIAEHNFTNGHHSMRLTGSLGFSTNSPDQKIDSRALVRQADRALYEAKADGKNCVRQYVAESEAELNSRKNRFVRTPK